MPRGSSDSASTSAASLDAVTIHCDAPPRPGVGPARTALRVLVCLSTADAVDRLPERIADVRRTLPEATVLVAHGGDDGSAEIARRMAAGDGRIALRRAPGGLAAARAAALREALRGDADLVVTMDGDGLPTAADAAELLAAVVAGADVAVGSRWVRGARSPGGAHDLRARVASRVAGLRLGCGVADVTGGFRAYRAAALREIGVPRPTSAERLQIDLIDRVVDFGLVLVEVPVVLQRGAAA